VGWLSCGDLLALLDALSLIEEAFYSLLPPLMATNIWMLSVGSDLPEVEEVAEDDRERMITKVERRRWRWLR
jgi:hypothetical protein